MKSTFRSVLTRVSGTALVLLAAANAAHAQIPGNPLSGLPGNPLGQLDRPLQSVEGLADDALDRVAQAPSRLRGLIRSSDGALEADPQGWPVVRGEIVAIGLSDTARAQALSQGYVVVREERLEALDLTTLVLAPPRGVSLARAVERLGRADPDAEVGFNHIYSPAGDVMDSTTSPAAATSSIQTGGSSGTIGLIDTGVMATHPALVSSRVTQRGFAGPARIGAHGTAVASLLTGRSGAFNGAAPGTSLLVADVYGGSASGGAATSLAQALAWMVENGVPVVNISLVGPRNPLVQAAVARSQARGLVLVAAVGNDGPAAAPLFPAGYPGVIGVTAVNARGRVLPEAGRGPQVDLTAQGADMAAAGMDGGYVTVRGTSFAAPLVAGLMARDTPGRPGRDRGTAAMQSISATTRDLGARGRDDVYGAGWVGPGLATAPRAVGARGTLSR